MYRVYFGLVLIFMVIVFSLPASGGTLKLVIDNKKVTLDTSPMIRKATVFVPLRGVFEEFKAEVAYDKKNSIVMAIRGKNTVVLKIGSTRAKVNGKQQIMLIPAFIQNNRTMVPLRFISEALGCEVNWEPGRSTVYINSKSGSTTESSSGDDLDIKDPDVEF